MRFTTLVTIATVSLVARAKLEHPPQQAVLVYPETEMPVDQVFQIGWIYTLGTLYGLASNVTTSLTNPRGNSTSIDRWTQTCQGSSELEVYQTALSVPDAGLYTVFWNFTYASGSDPTKANATSCGPGPFVYESYLFNKTFTATAATSVEIGYTSVTTMLPEQPSAVGSTIKPNSAASQLYLTQWAVSLVLAAAAILA